MDSKAIFGEAKSETIFGLLYRFRFTARWLNRGARYHYVIHRRLETTAGAKKKTRNIDTLARRSSNLFCSYCHFMHCSWVLGNVDNVFNAGNYNYIPFNRWFTRWHALRLKVYNRFVCETKRKNKQTLKQRRNITTMKRNSRKSGIPDR